MEKGSIMMKGYKRVMTIIFLNKSGISNGRDAGDTPPVISPTERVKYSLPTQYKVL